ncbi:hypothetical protein PILCRDRAFT_81771 [Piloderma croceum F 1598]|uniref:Tc1-like transposase DDE domain-containing protein n=1 Tax=Piloderma croceum (strain F 1598) TaxID=765440 RepID=A0A0C3EIV6_PILCF|nr:hypothetical protein PILCRDRAFT_81771 [Piloderma croceum F 1598]
MSTEALLTLDGIIAGAVVEGSMTKAMYIDYLAFTVLPQYSAFPGLLSVLVMDNVKIHHRQEILNLVAEFGMHMHWFLCCSDC